MELHTATLTIMAAGVGKRVKLLNFFELWTLKFSVGLKRSFA
jgi:hypothetical protein